MKRVIRGLLYDTEVSKLIYVEESTHRSLYQTPNGAFFTLYPTGEIVPKTEENTKVYLGERDADKYIEIFGKVEEA